MKVNISILIIVFVLAIGCTLAGLEGILIGSWQGTLNYYDDNDSKYYKGTATIIFKSDDSGSFSYSYNQYNSTLENLIGVGTKSSTFKITKSESINKTITFKFDNSDLSYMDGTYTYSLSLDRLAIYSVQMSSLGTKTNIYIKRKY